MSVYRETAELLASKLTDEELLKLCGVMDGDANSRLLEDMLELLFERNRAMYEKNYGVPGGVRKPEES